MLDARYVLVFPFLIILCTPLMCQTTWDVFVMGNFHCAGLLLEIGKKGKCNPSNLHTVSFIRLLGPHPIVYFNAGLPYMHISRVNEYHFPKMLKTTNVFI